MRTRSGNNLGPINTGLKKKDCKHTKPEVKKEKPENSSSVFEIDLDNQTVSDPQFAIDWEMLHKAHAILHPQPGDNNTMQEKDIYKLSHLLEFESIRIDKKYDGMWAAAKTFKEKMYYGAIHDLVADLLLASMSLWILARDMPYKNNQ